MRDRRRRHCASAQRQVHRRGAATKAPDPKTSEEAADARFGLGVAESHGNLAAFQTQLRSQSSDIDELEALNAELRSAARTLRDEIATLRTMQRADTQDLVHLAGKLLALSQASRCELDRTTKEIFRVRGWATVARKAEAGQ